MTDPGVIIRTANSADAPYLAEFGTRTFLAAFAENNNPADIDAHVAKAFHHDRILQELEDTDSRFLLAIADGTIIGYAKTRKGKPPDCVGGSKPIELERIYVDASKQSGGVGALLMQAVVEYAKGKGYDAVWLGAWEKNPDACRFYERHGFVAVGSKYFMVGSDRQNDVIMCRMLD